MCGEGRDCPTTRCVSIQAMENMSNFVFPGVVVPIVVVIQY